VPDSDALSPRHVTIEALIAWAGPTGDIQQRILEKSTASDGFLAAYGLSVLPTGHVRVELKTQQSDAFLTSAATLRPHVATHLVATYDGTTLALFTDGNRDSETPATGDIVPTVGLTEVGIGNQAEPMRERAFNGIVDEVALYAEALPVPRVQAHATAVAVNQANLVHNADFAAARAVAPPPLTGAGTGGLSAAEHWTTWNNPPATTITALLPTTREGGSGMMLHLITTAGSCGVVQQWANNDTGPSAAVAAAWVYVVRGTVALGSGNGGNTGFDVRSTTQGRWELLRAASGASPVNEVIVYATSEDGAEYFVDAVSVRALPEPATFIEQSVPGTLLAGQHVEVSVRMRNTGSQTWTADTGFRLGSRNPPDTLTWGLRRVELPGPVAPGEDAVFSFTVTAPPEPGTYAFQWRMLHDAAGWFGQATANVAVQVTGRARDAEFVSSSAPESVRAGQSFDAAVTMRNTGTQPWTPDALIRLACHGPDDNWTWGVNHVELPGEIAPGQNAVFAFTAIAPPAPGSYAFGWRMNQAGVSWFGSPAPERPIRVTGTSEAEFAWQSVPEAVSPGERFEARVAMRNTGSETWTPEALFRLGSQGPDDNWTWGLNRVELPGPVAPGQEAVFAFVATAPTGPGDYDFGWRMVQEGVTWFGQSSAPLLVRVIGLPDAEFVSQSVPEMLAEGEPLDVTVTMRNTGTQTWRPEAGFRLGSQNPQDNRTWGRSRVELPVPVAPEQVVELTFTATAPADRGLYDFQWQMVHEGVTWFGQATSNVRILVGGL
jgi:hypothetical protein